MSIVMSLFVNRSRMASPVDWAKAIRSSGFDMDMDSDFDPDSFTGFLPCKYGGGDAGFEYFREAVNKEELPDHVSAHVAERDTMINFVTHSDLRELATSMIASAVLCAISDGVLWETEADELVPASRALEWARSSDASIQTALGDARLHRR
jgi:hypothetical protein